MGSVNGTPLVIFLLFSWLILHIIEVISVILIPSAVAGFFYFVFYQMFRRKNFSESESFGCSFLMLCGTGYIMGVVGFSVYQLVRFGSVEFEFSLKLGFAVVILIASVFVWICLMALKNNF
jgi:hypothetical protein